MLLLVLLTALLSTSITAQYTYSRTPLTASQIKPVLTNFTDITPLLSNLQQSYYTVTLTQPFILYDRPYTKLGITTSGTIQFFEDVDNAAYDPTWPNGPMPYALASNYGFGVAPAYIAAFFTALTYRVGSATLGVGHNGTDLYIRYNNVFLAGNPSASCPTPCATRYRVSFDVILQSTSSIQIRYYNVDPRPDPNAADVPVFNELVIGVQDGGDAEEAQLMVPAEFNYVFINTTIARLLSGYQLAWTLPSLPSSSSTAPSQSSSSLMSSSAQSSSIHVESSSSVVIEVPSVSSSSSQREIISSSTASSFSSSYVSSSAMSSSSIPLSVSSSVISSSSSSVPSIRSSSSLQQSSSAVSSSSTAPSSSTSLSSSPPSSSSVASSSVASSSSTASASSSGVSSSMSSSAVSSSAPLVIPTATPSSSSSRLVSSSSFAPSSSSASSSIVSSSATPSSTVAPSSTVIPVLSSSPMVSSTGASSSTVASSSSSSAASSTAQMSSSVAATSSPASSSAVTSSSRLSSSSSATSSVVSSSSTAAPTSSPVLSSSSSRVPSSSSISSSASVVVPTSTPATSSLASSSVPSSSSSPALSSSSVPLSSSSVSVPVASSSVRIISSSAVSSSAGSSTSISSSSSSPLVSSSSGLSSSSSAVVVSSSAATVPPAPGLSSSSSIGAIVSSSSVLPSSSPLSSTALSSSSSILSVSSSSELPSKFSSSSSSQSISISSSSSSSQTISISSSSPAVVGPLGGCNFSSPVTGATRLVFTISNELSSFASDSLFGAKLVKDIGILSNGTMNWLCGTIVPVLSTRRRLLQTGPSATVTVFSESVDNGGGAAKIANQNLAEWSRADGYWRSPTADAQIPSQTMQASKTCSTTGSVVEVNEECPGGVSAADSDSGLSTGALAGIIVGSVVGGLLLCCLLLMICYCMRRQSRDHEMSQSSGPMSADASMADQSIVNPSLHQRVKSDAPVNEADAGFATTVPIDDSDYRQYNTPPEVSRVSEADPDASSQLHIHI